MVTDFRWLREVRRKHQLTQEDLAKRLGVHAWTVGRWEAGETVPRLHNLRALAELQEAAIAPKPGLCEGHLLCDGQTVYCRR